MSDEVKIMRDESNATDPNVYGSADYGSEELTNTRTLTRKVVGRLVVCGIFVVCGTLLYYLSSVLGSYIAPRWFYDLGPPGIDIITHVTQAVGMLIVFSSATQFLLLNYFEFGSVFPLRGTIASPTFGARRVARRLFVCLIFVVVGFLLYDLSDSLGDYFAFLLNFSLRFEGDEISKIKNLIQAVGMLLVFSGVAQFLLLNYLEFGSVFPSRGIIASPTPTAAGSSIVAGGLEDLRKGTFASIEELKSPLEQQLCRATSRLNREITNLGRRGNINLFIGIMTTIVGVCILVYVVYASVSDTDEIGWRSGIHTILRMSLAVFVQTFAYFFLRLYKTSLDDIKYYQNEITNIESKWLALNAVMEEKDKALLKIIVNSLSKTERNFILKKGDSTLGLERERLEKNEVIELVKDALGTASKIKTGK